MICLGDMMKRFQYIGRGGEIKWSDWFSWDSPLRDKYQFGRKLMNEYKE